VLLQIGGRLPSNEIVHNTRDGLFVGCQGIRHLDVGREGWTKGIFDHFCSANLGAEVVVGIDDHKWIGNTLEQSSYILQVFDGDGKIDYS